MTIAFYASRDIKRTRKVHTCESCERQIDVGSPAKYYAGKAEGDFYSAHYHPDCRAAEVRLNDEMEFGYDEFCQLWHLWDERADPDFADGIEGGVEGALAKTWPDVLARLQARDVERAARASA